MVERGGHIVPQGFVQIVTFTPLDIVLNPGSGHQLPPQVRFSLTWETL